MYKVFKVFFILFITVADIFCVFILFDEMRSKGLSAFDDASLFLLISLLIFSIPAFYFQFRTLRLFESKRFSEKDILDISLDEALDDKKDDSKIPLLLFLGNAAFGLVITAMGILGAMIFLLNASPNMVKYFQTRFLLVGGLLITGLSILLETFIHWKKYSKKA
jgi:hypothetical protein